MSDNSIATGQAQTEHLALPLPSADSTLEMDLPKLIRALEIIDTEVSRRAVSQQVADSLELIRLAINEIGATKVEKVNTKTGKTIVLKPEDVALGPANGPSKTVITYDGSGRVSTVVETVDGQPATITMAYNADGTVNTVTTTYRGRTRTETMAYAAGRVSGSNASEVQS